MGTTLFVIKVCFFLHIFSFQVRPVVVYLFCAVLKLLSNILFDFLNLFTVAMTIAILEYCFSIFFSTIFLSAKRFFLYIPAWTGVAAAFNPSGSFTTKEMTVRDIKRPAVLLDYTSKKKNRIVSFSQLCF